MIKYVHPVNVRSAKGLVALVYSQIKRDFGKIVEPFQLHSPLPRLLAGTWMACRETELVGSVPREIKEAVAATVSTINNCPYCVDAHTIMLKATGEHAIASAISQSRYNQISATKVRSIVQWILGTSKPNLDVHSLPPFSKSEAPEIIGTAVYYYYMTRMVTVLLGKTPLPSNISWLKNSLKRIASMMFSSAVHRPKVPGESLEFLAPANLPEDLRWTKANPIIAQAFARFAAIIDVVGEQALPLRVREMASNFIDKWQGESFGISRSWIEGETRGFDEASKSAAELTLLTAMVPYQVNKNTVLRFKRNFPEDDLLLGALAWGSFTAARKIGAWIQSTST